MCSLLRDGFIPFLIIYPLHSLTHSVDHKRVMHSPLLVYLLNFIYFAHLRISPLFLLDPVFWMRSHQQITRHSKTLEWNEDLRQLPPDDATNKTSSSYVVSPASRH